MGNSANLQTPLHFVIQFIIYLILCIMQISMQIIKVASDTVLTAIIINSSSY